MKGKMMVFSIFSFPTMFSKSFFCKGCQHRLVKSRVDGCVLIFTWLAMTLSCSSLLQHNSPLYQNTKFNPFPNKPWFLHVCNMCLLKKLREKEKSFVMRTVSHFHKFRIMSANSFSLEESKICR